MSQLPSGSADLGHRDDDYSVVILPDTVLASRSHTKPEDVLKKIGGALHQWSVARAADSNPTSSHAPFFRISKEGNSFYALTPSREEMLTLQETMKNLFAGDLQIVVGTAITQNAPSRFSIIISPETPGGGPDLGEVRRQLSEHGLLFSLGNGGNTLVAITDDPEMTIRMYREAQHVLRLVPHLKIQRLIEPVRQRSEAVRNNDATAP